MKVAISIGDLNGISLELVLKSHKKLSQICTPYYFLHESLLKQGLNLLKKKEIALNLVEFSHAKISKFEKIKEDKNVKIFSFQTPLSLELNTNFTIKAGEIDAQSGTYSFLSFEAACAFTHQKHAAALITLPIHKKAWNLAGISFRGHTDALRNFYGKNAIMMLGCKKLFVGLFSEHIALRDVSSQIKLEPLTQFLIDFYQESGFKKIGVLAFNPHAGDFGTIGGEEESIIEEAIRCANLHIQKEIYLPQILVADSAFTPNSLKKCSRLVAMYHDLALAPLKALYFEKSVNVSLNLPIIRTSVDHGTAFDKAYQNAKISTKSYKEAVKIALNLAKKRKKI